MQEVVIVFRRLFSFWFFSFTETKSFSIFSFFNFAISKFSRFELSHNALPAPRGTRSSAQPFRRHLNCDTFFRMSSGEKGMLPKSSSFAHPTIASMHVSEAEVSGRDWSRCRRRGFTLPALLGLICFVALQPSKSMGEAAFAIGFWGGRLSYGSAYDQTTQAFAQFAAMRSCDRSGGFCAVRGSFRKACFAIAVQEASQGWQTATSNNLDEAKRQALLSCDKMGSGCKIRDAFCDNVSETEVRAAEEEQSRVARSKEAEVRTKEADKYAVYLTRRNSCFDPSVPPHLLNIQVESCNAALEYPNANPDDRTRLLEQRSALLSSQGPRAREAISHAVNFLSVVAGIALIGWFGFSRRVQSSVFSAEERRTILGLCCSLFVGGWLLDITQRQPSMLHYAAYLSAVVFAVPYFVTSLVAIAVGTWTGSLARNSESPIPLRALLPVWMSAAVAGMAFLASRIVVYVPVDAWIITGLMFAWTFVIGYLLCDPIVAPWVGWLDKQLDQLIQKCGVVCARLRSLRLPIKSLSVKKYHITPIFVSGSAPSTMAVKIKRSQRKNFWGRVIFILDARMEVPAKEYAEIATYELGKQVIYDSVSREKHLENLKRHLETTNEQPRLRDPPNLQLLGILKTFYRFMLACISLLRMKLALRITVKKLIRGVHVESRSLKEVLDVEKAIIEAAGDLRAYLEVAGEFDGSEMIHGF
jgi:hypothetical protein